MSDLVKTVKTVKFCCPFVKCNYLSDSLLIIQKHLKEFHNVSVLPSGLDTLETMLKEELDNLLCGFSRKEIELIESVFARFKQEHGVE